MSSATRLIRAPLRRRRCIDQERNARIGFGGHLQVCCWKIALAFPVAIASWFKGRFENSFKILCRDRLGIKCSRPLLRGFVRKHFDLRALNTAFLKGSRKLCEV